MALATPAVPPAADCGTAPPCGGRLYGGPAGALTFGLLPNKWIKRSPIRHQGGMETKCPASHLLHRAHPRRLSRRLRPHDPQLDQERRAALLQARSRQADRPGRRRRLPRPAKGRAGMRRRRRRPNAATLPGRSSGSRDTPAATANADIAKPRWNRRQGHLRSSSAKPSRRSTRPTASQTAPTPWASTSPPGRPITRARNGPTRPTSTGSAASSRWR